MNIELLDKILAWLDAGAPHKDGEGLGFSMDHFRMESGKDYRGITCGTAMCIAGAAVEFSGDWKAESEYDLLHWIEEGAKALGIPYEDARNLFFARVRLEDDYYGETIWVELELESITPQDAAKVLRHYRDTGEVNWGLVEENYDYS